MPGTCAVDVLEAARAACDQDRRQEGDARRQPLASESGCERLEPLRVVADLQLEEAGARLDLLPGPGRPVVERRRSRVLHRADEQARGRLDRAAGQVPARRERRRDADELRAVEVEDAPRLRLVPGGHVVAGEAADVLDAVQRGADDVRLAGQAVLVAAHDLQHRLRAAAQEGDRDGDVRGMGSGGGVVGRIDRVRPVRDLLDRLGKGPEVAAVDRRRLCGQDRPGAELDQVPKTAHAPVQPPGRERSRPVTRFTHEEVPRSRLSTGGRSSSK